MDYVEAKEAQSLKGIRLALTKGVPGPWSESAKEILKIKGLSFTPVAQHGGLPNEDLVAWTGHRNAPIFVYNDELPRTGWLEILTKAEELSPAPQLIPSDIKDRMRMIGLANELCGENGLAWCRRLQMVYNSVNRDGVSEAEKQGSLSLGSHYGYSDPAAEAATARIIDILSEFDDQLSSQKNAGSNYLIGDTLSALDIYWACFAALLVPLPQEVNPMPPHLRPWYEASDDRVLAATTPALLSHRDMMYEKHLKLPLDF